MALRVAINGFGRIGRQILQVIGRQKEKFLEKMRKEAVKEIENAQNEARGKRVMVKFEDILLLRKRKMTIVFGDKQ